MKSPEALETSCVGVALIGRQLASSFKAPIAISEFVLSIVTYRVNGIDYRMGGPPDKARGTAFSLGIGARLAEKA